MSQLLLPIADLTVYQQGMSINKQMLRHSHLVPALGFYVYGLDLYSRTNIKIVLQMLGNMHLQESCGWEMEKQLIKENKQLYKKLTACRYVYFGPNNSEVCFMIFKGAGYTPDPDEFMTTGSVDDPYRISATSRYHQDVEEAPVGPDDHTWVPAKDKYLMDLPN